MNFLPKLQCMKQFFYAIAVACAAHTAQAQTYISETEEQYERSQAARGEAIAAFRAGDAATALAGMLKALEDRPTNVAVLGNAIFLAAETGNADLAENLTRRYLKMSVVPGAAVQQKLEAVLAESTWADLKADMDRLMVPNGSADVWQEVPTDISLVEDIADDRSEGFYASSVVSGTITHTDAYGNTRPFLVDEGQNFGSFFGLAYERYARYPYLYASYGWVEQTKGLAKENARTGILKLHPSTGEVEGNWTLPDGVEGQQIADLVATGRHGVYATDGQSGKIYKLSKNGLKELELNVALRSAQGIEVAYNDTLLVADYGRGLWRINLATNEAKLLEVPDTISLIGMDGLFMHRGRLIAVQNGVSPHRIIEIETDMAYEQVIGIKVLAQNLPEFDEPTLGVSTLDGILFVASSQWPKFGPGGEVREGQTIDPTRIMLIRD